MSWTDHGLRPLRSTLKHNCFCTSADPHHSTDGNRSKPGDFDHPKKHRNPLCFDRISPIGGSPCRPCAKPLSFKVLLKIRKPRMSTILDGKKTKNIGLRSISHFGIFMAGRTSKRTLKTCHIPSLFQSCHIHDSPHLKSALYTVVFDFLAAAKSRLLAQSLLHTCTAF